ncbi:MAG: hypothetical protein K8T91_12730 [Planctomycetes bacterium]|nr:hypothetical protein [Planctomycetota bacterium]
MFQVEWLKSVLDHLTDVWIASDSITRGGITAAVAEIDRRLTSDPHSSGESRGTNIRVDFVYPLSFTFHVPADSNKVTVVKIRVYRRRSR